jgi:hypothetical protein
MAGVGRMAAGVAIAAAAGMAAAAVRREIGKSKEPVPPDGSPVKPSYIDSTVQGPLTPPWKLRVTGGPEMGHIFHLKLQTSLGRGNDNDIQILDPEISRNHLRFDVRDDALVLTDLGSSRGTLVNGRKIDQPLPMKSGQVIEIGRSRFVVEETPSPQDAAQAVVPAQQSDPAPVAESAIWYYAEKDKQQGPVTESELRKRLAAGLPAETLVWNSQLDNWETAHELGLCPAPAKEPKPAAASAPAPEVLDWFFMEKGKQQGPVTEDALRQRLATGLPVETMVWNHKLETWKPAQTLGLCGTAAAPAQPAASPVPRTTPVPEAPIWYFMEKGARLGPVAESVIRQRLATGLPPDTQVWHAKLIHWKPAHELGLCAAPAPKPASPPVTAPAPALDAPLAAAAETPIWYFMDHGVRQGPVLESLLRQRLAHGLPPDTQVWNSKLDNWKPAHSLGLCPGAAPAPAVPTPKPATTPSPAQGKTCKKCGRTLSPQHRFCAGCGSPV